MVSKSVSVLKLQRNLCALASNMAMNTNSKVNGMVMVPCWINFVSMQKNHNYHRQQLFIHFQVDEQMWWTLKHGNQSMKFNAKTSGCYGF